MTSLPSGWVLRPLNELGGSDRPAVKAGPFGSALKKEFYSRAGYRVYGQEQVIADNFAVGDYYIDEKRFQTLRSCEVRTGDVLISLVGTFGKASIVPADAEPGIINPRLIRLSLDPDRVEPRYLKAFLGSPLVQQQFEAVAHGGTMGVLNATTIAPLELPLPPLKEQRRIVAKLESLQSRSRRAREALDAVPQLLEKLRQSILAAAFRGDLTKDWRAQNPNPEPASALFARIRTERRQKWEASQLAKLKAKGKAPINENWKKTYDEQDPLDEKLPDLPSGWAWARLNDLARVLDPNPSHRYPDYENGSVPIVSTQEFVGIEDWDCTRSKLVPDSFWRYQRDLCEFSANDIVFARKGRLGLARRPPRMGAYAFSHTVFIVKSEPLLDSSWMLWFLRQSAVVAWLLREMNSNTGVPTLGKAAMERLPVAVPPLAEQLTIAQAVHRAFDLIGALGARADCYGDGVASLERSLLAKAFRGELVQQDPNDEPAALVLARVHADVPTQSPRRSQRRPKAAE